MGLARLLTLLALAWLAYLVWIRLRGLRRPPTASRRTPAGGHMVRCRRCGLFVPETEAVRDARGETYCSVEHRRAAAGDRGS
ncbi:MAG: hypothetical protein D6721_07520 [Gammaproteobacteria bacterium]|nr:MAG: hypothetical protein D6721_07520 [Gammaproteobacteria bacterium]